MPFQKVQGFAWPFRFGPLGRPNRSAGTSKIKQNLKCIVLTEKGERVRERNAGTVGFQFVFRNVTAARGVLMTDLIKDGCMEHEPRAILGTVTLQRVHDRDGSKNIFGIPFVVAESGEDDVAEIIMGEKDG